MISHFRYRNIFWVATGVALAFGFAFVILVLRVAKVQRRQWKKGLWASGKQKAKRKGRTFFDRIFKTDKIGILNILAFCQNAGEKLRNCQGPPAGLTATQWLLSGDGCRLRFQSESTLSGLMNCGGADPA